MASLREFLSTNSELHEDADENESGFLGSFAYGETQKNTPFVRLCTDETVDEGDGMCEFPCTTTFTHANSSEMRRRPRNDRPARPFE